MLMQRTVLALVMTAGIAQADITYYFTYTPSVGPLGDPANSAATSDYARYIRKVSGVRFAGTLRKINPLTRADEAWWNLRNTGFGTSVNIRPSNVGEFADQFRVHATFPILMWNQLWDEMRFEAWESVDDVGIDAQWTNVEFELFDLVTPSLGDFPQSTTFFFDTYLSNFDTEIALFALDGTLLAVNDDAGGSAQSALSLGQLEPGTYWIVTGGFDSTFMNGFAVGGAAAGTLQLRLNGAVVAGGATLPANLFVRTFRVVPDCPADFTADGFVDFFDYDAFVACFEGVSCPSLRDADINGDGFTDFFDYDDYVAVFESGC